MAKAMDRNEETAEEKHDLDALLELAASDTVIRRAMIMIGRRVRELRDKQFAKPGSA